jgi:hypothetical protein
MIREPFSEAGLPAPPRHWHRMRHGLRVSGALMLGYGAVAYLLLPGWWHLHGRPATEKETPTITNTKSGIPGDPVNLALIGTEEEVVGALHAAGWVAADETTWKTSVRICKSVVLRKAYDTAPMSKLYLLGRAQDLAFQQPVGKSPRQRHHVRFWRADKPAEDGRSLWLGAATFDVSVGFSHRTVQVTHHIAAEVDAERDKLIDDLQRAGRVDRLYRVPGVGKTSKGRNGGGDRYVTDGERVVAVLLSRKSESDPE